MIHGPSALQCCRRGTDLVPTMWSCRLSDRPEIGKSQTMVLTGEYLEMARQEIGASRVGRDLE